MNYLITPDFGVLFWQTITLLTVLWVLAKFAWKPIIGVLQAREEAVAHSISQISAAQTSMAQATVEREQLLEEANLERERIINESLETKQKIIEQARQEGITLKEQLLAEAKLALEREKKRVLEEAKSHIGLLSIQIAEKLLCSELRKDQEQLALIERFITGEKQFA
ncbi:MAG: F0F1 ATP synthase subunit B [Candidatus Cardinium sp.]|nr:F0F1 ATP synthase subunit B [Candidatus Cardinium sp.]